MINNKIDILNINILSLLNGNSLLLIFVILVLGLFIGRLRFGTLQLGSSIGILLVSLLLGKENFVVNTEILNVGFFLFIFCVGIESGPNFFSIFFRDGKNYFLLTLILISSAVLTVLSLSYLFHWDNGMAAGILAGSLTCTPVIIGADDTLRQILTDKNSLLLIEQHHLSLGYALTYLVGLVSLIFGAHYLPKLQKHDLATSAQQIARDRGLDKDLVHKEVWLPVIRAYLVGPELIKWIGGKNLRELGIYLKTGCYIERIRRNGIVAKPNGDDILQLGDEISLIGYPEAHARLAPSFCNGREVFTRDLLNMRIVTEKIIVKNPNIINKRLIELRLIDHGCFLNHLIRSQIEIPIEENIILNKGDVLQVSGEEKSIKIIADRIGFISIHNKLTDLLAFCSFFVIGLIIGMVNFQINHFTFSIGNATGLLLSGIMLGSINANHPTFGYIPQGALTIVKELGLMIFMTGIGLNAGNSLHHHGGSIIDNSGVIIAGLGGLKILLAGLIVSLLPVIISFCFGTWILHMNQALLFGALMGARTCAPAMEVINNASRSNIPALGYAGTYAIANILLTLTGTLIIIIWPLNIN